MNITRQEKWYRPYYFTASGKSYKANKIVFYKDGKIITSSQSGWLEEKTGRDIEELSLPVDEVKVKRKEKFDGTVFAISLGKEPYGNETIADLYIPADMLNIHFVEYKIMYNSQLRAIYEGDQGIYISQYVKNLDGKLREIRNQFEEVLKRIDKYSLDRTNIEDIDKLKSLVEEYKEEQERVYEMSLEYADKDMEEN